jgi:hypothetical protein
MSIFVWDSFDAEGTCFTVQETPMFCPQCGAEYVAGITKCADCRIALTPDPPVEKETERPDFHHVLTLFNVGDIAVLRSVLDSAQIEYVFDGENFNLLDPMIQPVRLFVKGKDADAARELIAGMNIHYLSVSPREDAGDEK